MSASGRGFPPRVGGGVLYAIRAAASPTVVLHRWERGDVAADRWALGVWCLQVGSAFNLFLPSVGVGAALGGVGVALSGIGAAFGRTVFGLRASVSGAVSGSCRAVLQGCLESGVHIFAVLGCLATV